MSVDKLETMLLCGVVEPFLKPVAKRHDMVDKDDLREQFTEAFQNADYPISSPMDLVPALPNGPSTKFESGDFSMTAMELNTKLGGEFPYESVDAFVDDVMDQLEDQDLI
jgi:hypothetical protein